MPCIPGSNHNFSAVFGVSESLKYYCRLGNTRYSQNFWAATMLKSTNLPLVTNSCQAACSNFLTYSMQYRQNTAYCQPLHCRTVAIFKSDGTTFCFSDADFYPVRRCLQSWSKNAMYLPFSLLVYW